VSICFDCASENKDEALNLIKQQAKKQAVEHEKAMAVFKEGSTYFIIEAGAAIAGSYPVICFVSQHE